MKDKWMVEKGYNYWGAYEYSVHPCALKGRGELREQIYRKLHLSTFHLNWRDCASWLESMVREKRSMVIKVQNRGETSH